MFNLNTDYCTSHRKTGRFAVEFLGERTVDKMNPTYIDGKVGVFRCLIVNHAKMDEWICT